MEVAEALATRITCRAFRDAPVPRATVEAILTAASRAPSGGNLQPWRVWALAGPELAALQGAIKARIATGALSDGQTEYSIYPPDMGPPFSDRKFAAGAAMYAALGVDHADMAGQLEQYVRNFELFGAPVGLVFAIDRSLQPGQWADLGMYMQSVMLLARDHGLHTAAMESWALWHATIRQALRIPDELMIFCAMALGHMDEAAPINRVRTERAPLAEFAVLRGF
ncbi:nitroreductase [Phenylobacterium sp.]|uniref:nitroreductase n=1 Tax=Phenylobacterium sp. TaxID=1871053 RepID=UPI0027229C81|nr:nitroreductase [Phenylobacterium sp.]MDO8379758.1 nitroreductase [Phenylobacterium sp.]